jgi:transposase
MNEKNAQEIALRRQAFKLFDNAKSMSEILQRIPRSRSWLYKWKQRFDQDGFAALDSLHKAPRSSPQAYPSRIRWLTLSLRKRFSRAVAGLVGARAIRRELRHQHGLKRLPSLSTIHRWLKAAKLIGGAVTKTPARFYPHPQIAAPWVFHACDWTMRHLEGGQKVFAFHSLDLHTQALWQTLLTDKSTHSVITHALEVWQELALPDFLQLDNDAAFTGLGKKGRIFGQFVRLALYLGIELIFIPPAEPKRNAKIERVNGLWAESFWEKNRFKSFGAVRRKQKKFFAWYESYAPPSLKGLSVKEANQTIRRRRLKRKELPRLDEKLPLRSGRIHFIRRVSEQGEIEILKERWKVSKRLAQRYVWATLLTGQQRLEIYYRASERGQVRLIKTHAYEIEERVWPLPASLRRKRRRMRVKQMI